MRRYAAALLTPLLAPLLASCGSSEPPGVEFDRPVATVYTALAAVDGRVDMQGLLKSPAVTRKQGSHEELVFLLGSDSAEHRGQITFRFADAGDGHSRVSVDAEVPEIKSTIGGQPKVLSEAKIEGLLAERLQALAKRMNRGGVPTVELDELDQAIAFTALALDPKEVNRAIQLAGNDSALASALAGEAEWNRDSSDDWQTASVASDETEGDETFADDTFGDDAAGDDPEPDSDYGAASE